MVSECDALRNLVPFVQFKKQESTYGGVLLLLKLQVLACNFTESNTPPCGSFTFVFFSNGTKSHEMSQMEFPQM